MSEREKILSSTGELGLFPRGDERLYFNWPYGVITEPDRLYNVVGSMFRFNTIPEITRCVFRAPISSQVLEQLKDYGLEQYLEVAARLPLESDSPVYLVYLSQNSPQRQASQILEEMIVQTTTKKRITTFPLEIVRQVVHQGYSLKAGIEPNELSQITCLWQSTFGWTKQEVENLALRLANERLVAPQDRTVWYSSVWQEDQLVCLAMAERLDVPLAGGEFITLTESTEWVTKPSFRQNGLAQAAVSYLHSQVLQDSYYQRDGYSPFIFGEANVSTGAYKVGWYTGMEIPPRQILGLNVPQILIQNVSVGNGQWGLEDFALLHLPYLSVDSLFSIEGVQEMIELAQRSL